jgi:hypothetical protein
MVTYVFDDEWHSALDETLSMHELATERMHEMYAGEDEEQAIVPTVVVYTVDGSRGRASVALVAK